jgi:hypothetical protein
MAVLTATELGLRLPIGNYFQKSFTVALTTNDATDEWIVTGFDEIISVTGGAVQGATAQTETPNFVINAQGTAATAGANPGDLGIEVPDTTNSTLHVTVIGR